MQLLCQELCGVCLFEPAANAYMTIMALVDSAGYSITVMPIDGRVTLKHGEVVVASSTQARIMHETRLAPTIYFPRADVFGLSETPTDHRTFCPFKGTATYWDLTVDGKVLENAAWSYEPALPDASDVEGYIAFMPGVVNDAAMPPMMRPSDGHVSGALIDWIMRSAWQCPDPAELTRQFCEKLVEHGVAVSRLNIVIWSRHPQIAGVAYLWKASTGKVEVNNAHHENLTDIGYTNSPIRHVTLGLGGVRQPLNVGDVAFKFPIMDELKEEGATDYVAMPLNFSDGQINVMTMATDHPDGFTTANLGLVFECSAVISRFFEVMTLRANAETLLGTYLGRATGARVLGGEYRRGDGEEIDAAILFCDLRGSSRLEESLGHEAYLNLLNRFFDTTVNQIREEGGEVLKFIGDAVLAIFPDEQGSQQSCSNAAKAALAIVDKLAEIDIPGHGRAECAVGIAHGHVTYGNVGSSDRLDFTVIGAAANVAARLSDLGKSLGEPVLVTEPIAQASNASSHSLGAHSLHNVGMPVHVFAPKQSVAADREAV